jgi:hypothetical protein
MDGRVRPPDARSAIRWPTRPTGCSLTIRHRKQEVTPGIFIAGRLFFTDQKSVTRKSTRADARLSHSLQDEAIEAGGEGRGVLRQFAVKNLRLFQQ